MDRYKGAYVFYCPKQANNIYVLMQILQCEADCTDYRSLLDDSPDGIRVEHTDQNRWAALFESSR